MKKLIKRPSAAEMARFIAELCEQEVHFLACGGGTLTELTNSFGWLRWVHGKRQLLRLAVHRYLSRPRGEPESVDDRIHEILHRYYDRRLHRELVDLRASMTDPALKLVDPVKGVNGEELARLDELIDLV